MAEQLSGEFDPRRHQTLLEILQRAVELYGDKPAYTCLSHTLTYREVDSLSDRFAQFLQHHTTLSTGDRIALQLPNLLQFPIALYGALKAGLIVVNTNPLYTAREMRYQFKDAGVKGVVILSSFCDKLESILDDTEIQEIIVTELGDMQSPLRRLVINFGARYIKKLIPSYRLPSATAFITALNKGGNSTLELAPISSRGDDAVAILYTGGTTGYAKGVVLSHNNLLANMMQFRVRCLDVISDGQESIAAPLPLYHSYAFLLHCFSMPYAGNHNHLIPNPRDLDSVIRILKKYRITGFAGINTLYLALLQREEIRTVDFKAMRFCGAGGMPLTRRVAEEWEHLTGCRVFEGYGLTECSPIVAINSPDRNKPGTVGLPMAETEVKVMDDGGSELTAGEIGELWIRGPQVMQGYWQKDSDTEEVLSSEGWFKTGDFVQQDSEGYIKIVDRKKDMILVSGFNVIPGEIEDYVNTHKDVLESAAIGVPDESSGEKVVLYAVLKRGSTLMEEQLKHFCREGLAAYKVPRHIYFTDELPKSNIGKVLRRNLREQYATRL